MQDIINSISTYGYIVLFFYSLGGGMVALIAAGILSFAGKMDLTFSIAVAAAANTIGDTLLFYVARFNKSSLMPYIKNHTRKLAYAGILAKKHGDKIIFIKKFIYGVKTLVPVALGLTKYSFYKFSIINLISSILWAVIVGFASFKAGDYFMSANDYLGEHGYIMPLVMFSLLFGIWYFLQHMIRKDKSMKKLISALVVVIVVAVGAVYIASNKVEEHYQRTVDKLNGIKGFKVSENKYEKGLFGSNGSFDLTVSKDFFYNIIGEEIDEDLKFKVESAISHSVLAFLNGFEIDSKVSIQNDMIKNIVAIFLGSNVIATAKTKATLAGNKDINVKFSDIDFNDKKTKQLATKDVKFGIKIDAKENIDSANIEVGKVAFKNYDEENKDSIEAEGIYIDTAYLTPIELSKVFESKIAPYVANAKFKKVALLSESEDDIVVDDFDYKSKFEVSNDLGSSNDVIKIGAVTISKLKYTDFTFESKLSNINVPALNKVLDNLSSTNRDKVLGELDFDEPLGQILEKKPNLKVSNLSFKNGDKSFKLNLDAAVNGFKNGSTYLEFLDELSLEGKLSVDESLTKFFDTAFPEIAFFEPTLVSAGYLKEEGKKVVSDFKYDPSKKDVIFNGKVGLQNFFMGF